MHYSSYSSGVAEDIHELIYRREALLSREG